MPLYGNWMKVGTDLVVGGAAGVVDQLVANEDEKRHRAAAATGKKLELWKEFGTYVNYGVPVLTVAGVGFNMLRGDMATRLLTAGGQLAARKITQNMTRASTGAAWRAVPSGPVSQTTKPGFEMVEIH